ncbi:MAG TPA: aliphatic sulfonate ABC transporter substrate-binding protein [Bacillota bacterium]|nr:aliphatic sulfonate ABC transporter substrate-binding protein [Bacillota bacterium]HOL09535.1 aliphatic sulfonate ABC transporter substrate-binding protein [Bacillota bacterium]HPO97494.1 aliphatic sulfonate ABC transporter substrate-binding protein [Bacillota bacterium]
MKKILKIILLISIIALVFAPLGYGKVQRGNAAKELRIALQPIPFYAPLFIAKQQGWLEAELKQEKAKLKWHFFLSGPAVNEAFAAGQIDIGLMGDTPALIARASGQDLRIVSLAASGPKAQALAIPKNSNIKSVKELKGKRVAVIKGTGVHHFLALAFQKNGLKFNDVQIVNLQIEDIGAALTSGNVEAGAIWEPYITQWVENGGIRILTDGTGIKRGLSVILVSNKFAVQNPALVNALLKAYQRGYEFLKAAPQQAAELVAKEVNLTPKQLLQVFTKFNYWPGISDADIDDLKKSEEFMRDQKIIRSKVDIDAFVDRRYLQAAGIK